MKTACIYHSIDLDGWMSAAIVKHWFIKTNNPREINNHITFENHASIADCDTSLDFIGYNYGQPIPDLSEYDKVIMCDISFPKEEMSNVRGKKGNNFIWIDHHISAINDAKEIFKEYYGSFNGLRDTKFAACELTWKYFFPNEPVPEIVRLLGRYDCFGHKGTDEEQKVLEFQYGARSCISNYEEAYEWLLKVINDKNRNKNPFDLKDTHHIDVILNKGKYIYKYLCTEAKQTYKDGFGIHFKKHYQTGGVQKSSCPVCGAMEVSHNSPLSKYDCGTTSYDDRPGTFNRGEQCVKDTYNFICINEERFNPINFGIDYHKDGYDGVACFHFDGTHWNFSLYNDNGLVDCSAIAKQFGGGGHKGAAGFRLPFKSNNIDSFIRARIVK